MTRKRQELAGLCSGGSKLVRKGNRHSPRNGGEVIPAITPAQPEKAQIVVEDAGHLHREIRVNNTLQDADGNEVSLKKGATVEVTIAADPEATAPKK